jgi:hypothetical protein
LLELPHEEIKNLECKALKKKCNNLDVIFVTQYVYPRKTFSPGHPIEKYLVGYKHKNYKDVMKSIYGKLSYLDWCFLNELHQLRAFYVGAHESWPVYAKTRFPQIKNSEEPRPELPRVATAVVDGKKEEEEEEVPKQQQQKKAKPSVAPPKKAVVVDTKKNKKPHNPDDDDDSSDSD